MKYIEVNFINFHLVARENLNAHSKLKSQFHDVIKLNAEATFHQLHLTSFQDEKKSSRPQAER